MSCLPPLTLAATPLTDGLALMIVGMAVVFAALALLLAVISLINRLGEVQPATTTRTGDLPTATATQVPGDTGPQATADLPTPAAAPTPSPVTADPQLIAVLAAAATAVLHRPVRVRRVQFVQRSDTAWAQMGRQDIMTSHRPARR